MRYLVVVILFFTVIPLDAILPLDLSYLSEGLYLLNVGDEVTERVLILK